MAASLRQIAAELSVVHPSEFIAARAARAAETPDRDTAALITKLRRPAPAAWVVNLLRRDRAAELDELAALGAESRAAQTALDRAAMTALAARRRASVAALVREGRDLAAHAGHPVADSVLEAVAATLDAAAADPEAADAVRSGRLVRPLESIGFEPVDLVDAVAVPEPGSRAVAPPREDARPRAVVDPDREVERARREADAALAAAEDRATEAETARTAAQHELARQESERRELEADAADLDERMRELRAEIGRLDRSARAIARRLEGATRDAERAEAALETARRRRADLG